MKQKFKALSIIVVTSASLLFVFQNCSQTKFTQVPLSGEDTKAIVGIEVEGLEGDSSSSAENCRSVPLHTEQIDLGATAEGHEVLGYKVGELNCRYTSFLVKVKAYGQFDTFLVYRKRHNANQIELISKSAEGYPVFVYEKSVSLSGDGKYVIYSPHRIVDRSPTPIVPEFVHRRNIQTGQIDIVNQTAYGVLAKPVYPDYGFNQKTAESKDGNIILFRSAIGRGGTHLFRKDMMTGELHRLSGNDASGVMDLSYPITSFSVTADGGVSLHTQHRADSESIESLLSINLNNLTSIVTGNGTASHYDGVDEKVVGNTIISADGKYAYFEGDYRGGRQQQVANRQIIKRDLETGVSKVVSRNDETSQVGYNWSLQSVSDDGRYFCFLSTQTNLTNVNAQTLVAEVSNAYVKDTVTGRIAQLAPASSSCAISGDAMNASYSSGQAIYQSRINWNSSSAPSGTSAM
jgi:hypothetical protein